MLKSFKIESKCPTAPNYVLSVKPKTLSQRTTLRHFTDNVVQQTFVVNVFVLYVTVRELVQRPHHVRQGTADPREETQAEKPEVASPERRDSPHQTLVVPGPARRHTPPQTPSHSPSSSQVLKIQPR